MKRTLYCPLLFSSLTHDNCSEYLEMLQQVEAKYVFIAVARDFIYTENSELHQTNLNNLEWYIRYFQKNDLQVGVWVNSFGFGNLLDEKGVRNTKGMTTIKSVRGKVHKNRDEICPEDPAFTSLFCTQIQDIAKLKPDLIMLDDDLCLSVRPGIGCFCDRHIKLLEEKIGYKLNVDTLFEDIFTGHGNPLRNAWLDVMGTTLKNFCSSVRNALDSVDPSIRLGFCAGYTSWDMEGATALELTYILAGNTKPFLRFTSAPYWVSKVSNRFPGQRLHGIIEFAREQAHWCKDTNIEFFSEADSHPRARYQVPANLLECFDASIVASDGMNTLKYLFDYFSSPGYEKGYLKIHNKNRMLYDFLETHFADKKTRGIQVFERMQKISDIDLPSGLTEKQTMTYSLPVAASVLTSIGIPVTYEENPDCGVAFNVNVDMIDTMPKRMILDMPAAMRLQEKGIDVGIENAQLISGTSAAAIEKFDDEIISLADSSGRYYTCDLKENASVKSVAQLGNGLQIPLSYTYNNGTTEFLVYTFDAYSLSQSATIFCSYGRQQQILDFYSDFPVLRKCPYVYQLCKQNDKETVAFFANIFEDELFDFEIELDQNYKEIDCFGIDATLNDNHLKVNSEVAPYGMFAIRLIK